MICPFCGHDNIPGVDRCYECMHSFRDLDIPQPKAGFQKDMMKDAISRLNLTHPVNVSVNDSVARTVELMKLFRVGCALVLDEQKLVGIFTERDILLRLTDPSQDWGQMAIHQIMVSNPVKLRAEDSIATALHYMSVGGFRHLPVVATDGTLLGLVSIKDIVGYIYQKWFHA